MKRSDLTETLLLIAVGLLLYNIFTTGSVETNIKGYKKEIKRLQTKIDSAHTVNKKLNLKIDSVFTSVNTITKEITLIDRDIKIIRKNTNEKVNTIDNLSNVELEQFFTSRYYKNLPSQ
jgi:septal ring factor EnvC (AmiA/AmiB activator)